MCVRIYVCMDIYTHILFFKLIISGFCLLENAFSQTGNSNPVLIPRLFLFKAARFVPLQGLTVTKAEYFSVFLRRAYLTQPLQLQTPPVG